MHAACLLLFVGLAAGPNEQVLDDFAYADSEIARRATLDNYLEAVSSEIEFFYQRQAERALNIPSSYFNEYPLEKVRHFFKKKHVEGAKQLFAVRYDGGGRLVTFDPRTKELGKPAEDSVARAIYVALAPWQALAHKEAVLQSHDFSVDERDPENRMILKPISEEGMVLV